MARKKSTKRKKTTKKRKRRAKRMNTGEACQIITAHGKRMQVCRTINKKTGKEFYYLKGWGK